MHKGAFRIYENCTKDAEIKQAPLWIQKVENSW